MTLEDILAALGEERVRAILAEDPQAFMPGGRTAARPPNAFELPKKRGALNLHRDRDSSLDFYIRPSLSGGKPQIKSLGILYRQQL